MVSPFDFVNNVYGALLIVGGLLVLLVMALLAASRVPGATSRTGLSVGLGTVAVLLIAGLVITAANTGSATSSLTPPPAGAQLSSYIIAPGGGSGVGNTVPGCSVSSVTNTMTCDVDFNYTANYFYACSGNLTGGATRTACIAHNYLLVGIHSARTDALNATYGFPYAISSVPTVTTAGSTPTVFSPDVGYVVATGTTPGVWKTYWGSGSTASLNPTNVAPGSTSGFTSSLLGIGAFGGAVNVLHISLPGSNSTFAPTWPTTGTAASTNTGLTLYASYSTLITVGNSNPTTFTLTLVLIGFTT